jgi:hypothetical protein
VKSVLVRDIENEKPLVVKIGDLVQYDGERFVDGIFVALVLDITSTSFTNPTFKGVVLYSENANRKVGSVEEKFLNHAFKEFKGQLKLQN